MREKYTLVADEVRVYGVRLLPVPPEARHDNTQRRLVEDMIRLANEADRRALYAALPEDSRRDD